MNIVHLVKYQAVGLHHPHLKAPDRVVVLAHPHQNQLQALAALLAASAVKVVFQAATAVPVVPQVVHVLVAHALSCLQV